MKAGQVLSCLQCGAASLKCPENKLLIKHIQQWAEAHIKLTGHYQYEVK